MATPFDVRSAHVQAIDFLSDTLNALVNAAKTEDWVQLEVLEPDLRIALDRLKANPQPATSADFSREILEGLLAMQQQISDCCKNRMSQLLPLLTTLSANKPPTTNP